MKNTTLKTIQSKFKGMKLKTDASRRTIILKGKYHRRIATMKSDQYAKLFFFDFGKAVGIALDKQMKLIRTKTDSAGNQSFFFAQYIGEARVHPGIAVVFINAERQLTYAKVKCLYEGIPKLEDYPLETALADLRRKKKVVKMINKPEVSIYTINQKEPTLCWNIHGMAPNGHIHGYFYDVKNKAILATYDDHDHVDAVTTGIGINPDDELDATPVRTINVDDPGAGANLQLVDNTRTVAIEVYDMAGSDNLDDPFDLCEDDDGDGVFNDITNVPRTSSNRPEVDAIYNTGIVADYYLRSKVVNGIALFGRDGWAGDGSEDWINYVHYGGNGDVNSSFYSRSRRKIFHADGDGVDLSYKAGLDTSAHEWNHAVQATEITGGASANGGFNGDEEPFVVKEALSDIFAGFTNKDSGWRMGSMLSDDIALPAATFAGSGLRFRSLITPSVSDSPDHFEQDACTLGYGWDNTGQADVLRANYRRIGILNKAAYLQAMGGQHPSAATDPATYPPIDVIGMGVSKLENIYYYALTMLMDPAELLLEYREDVILACETLYPADECCCKQIMNGFDAVGIYEVGNTPPARPAGPDLFITPWGSKFGTAPYWKSPDVYTKDGAGNIVNPLKGIINTLCANVTNKGDAAANGTEVSFYYSPYGMGYRHEDFFLIGTETVDIPANSSLEVCTDWDLTDLAFDNGGLWPFPIDDFDHFCVQVIIEHPDDVDNCNNETQHNFTEVLNDEVDSDGVEATFLVSNPSKQLNLGAIVPEWEGDMQFNNRLNGLEGLLSNTNDLSKLLQKYDVDNLPQQGILFAIRPGEKRKLSFRLDRKNKRSYKGKVKGHFTAAVTSRALPGKKTFSGNVYHLTLPKTSTSNIMIALVRGVIITGEGKLAAKGRIKGKITHKSGKFYGKFYGVLLRTNKKISLTVKGQLSASANMNYSIHMNGVAPQGFDFVVKIV